MPAGKAVVTARSSSCCSCRCSSGEGGGGGGGNESKSRPPVTVSVPLLPLLLTATLLACGPALLARIAELDAADWTAELTDSLLEAVAGWANPGSDPGSSPCLVSAQSGWLQMLLQADTGCDHCANLSRLPELQGSADAGGFRRDFLDRNLPVVLRGAAANWPAVAAGGLTLDLLRRIHRKQDTGGGDGGGGGGGGGASVICQMFDYKGQFPTLPDFFRWSRRPGNLQLDGWYVGWNVCNQRVARHLRRLYSRPGFLGNDSEHGATEWIFVGGPGKGAPAHIDAVYYNTWQAQIQGSKWWRLRPPLNCYYICPHVYEVLLRPGDIIALKTSKWIHETEVAPGDVSIALGAEFD